MKGNRAASWEHKMKKQKEYRKTNQKKIRGWRKSDREKNREEMNAYQREYRRKRKEKNSG